MRVGDFIRLENGQAGYVKDIWMAHDPHPHAHRMLTKNPVIVPNAKLTQSILTNYYLPEPRMTVLIPISVSYRAEPDLIERVLVEEVFAAIGHVPGFSPNRRRSFGSFLASEPLPWANGLF